MSEKLSIEILIRKNLDQLPVHATYWKVNKAIQKGNSNNFISTINNGIIARDLMYKPISTFYNLSINVKK